MESHFFGPRQYSRTRLKKLKVKTRKIMTDNSVKSEEPRLTRWQSCKIFYITMLCLLTTMKMADLLIYGFAIKNIDGIMHVLYRGNYWMHSKFILQIIDSTFMISFMMMSVGLIILVVIPFIIRFILNILKRESIDKDKPSPEKKIDLVISNRKLFKVFLCLAGFGSIVSLRRIPQDLFTIDNIEVFLLLFIALPICVAAIMVAHCYIWGRLEFYFAKFLKKIRCCQIKI